MRSCLLVKDGVDDAPLCAITANELYPILTMSAGQLMTRGFSTDLRGSGTDKAPYAIDTFLDINTYIDRRNERRAGRMHFRFCGVDMFQDGNDADSEQKYYIGLVGEDPLSYPGMRTAIGSGGAIGSSGFKAESVKAAVGVSTDQTYELLALACLFIAEGRRDRHSLLTHLLLMDLIADGVTYGSAGNKVRTLSRAVDIPKNTVKKWAEYGGLSAAGDSPFSQKDAVKQMKQATEDTEVGTNRYFDKTISIATQWVAHYFSSPKFKVETCKPTDIRPGTLGTKLDSHIDTTIEARKTAGTLKKKNREKARQFDSRVRLERERMAERLRGVPNEVKSYIGTMFNVRLKNAQNSHETAATFTAFDPKTDMKDLRAAVT